MPSSNWEWEATERGENDYTKELRNPFYGLEITAYTDKNEPHTVILESYEENSEGDVLNRELIKQFQYDTEREAETKMEELEDEYEEGIGEETAKTVVQLIETQEGLKGMIEEAIKESDVVSDSELQRFIVEGIEKSSEPESKELFTAKVTTEHSIFEAEINHGTTSLDGEFQNIILSPLEVCLTEVN